LRSKSSRLGTIMADIPVPPETTHAKLFRQDILLFQTQLTKETPSLELVTRTIKPKGVQELTWSASHPTAEKYLRYWVFLDYDGHLRSLSGPLLEPRFRMKFDSLPGCESARIVVRASTGFHVAEVSTKYFKLSPKPPSLRITHPKDGSRLLLGAPLQLRGRVLNRNTGKPLSDDLMEWSIDGGFVGTGHILVVEGLSIGRHQISLQVHAGNFFKTVTVDVVRKSREPPMSRSTKLDRDD